MTTKTGIAATIQGRASVCCEHTRRFQQKAYRGGILLISGHRGFFPFLNLIIYGFDACFVSLGCMLPIKHIIQVVTWWYAGLLALQPNDVERGSNNFVGMLGRGIPKVGSGHHLISSALFHPLDFKEAAISQVRVSNRLSIGIVSMYVELLQK